MRGEGGAAGSGQKAWFAAQRAPLPAAREEGADSIVNRDPRASRGALLQRTAVVPCILVVL